MAPQTSPDRSTAASLTVLQKFQSPLQDPHRVYLAGLSPSGRRTMGGALNLVAGLLSDGHRTGSEVDRPAVRFEHVVAIRTLLTESGRRPATVNKILCAVRGVLKAAWNLGQMSTKDYQRAKDVGGIKSVSLPHGRMLDHHEIGRLKQACDPKTPSGVRDRAILGVLSRAGLRRAELVALDLADFTESAKGEGSLRVKGKGNKERLVPLANGALDVLKDWIAVRGAEPGPMFLPIAKGGTVGTNRFSTEAVYGILRRMAKRADGVPDFSPHDLRRTAGSEMLDAGADLSVVADILGHASVEVTRRSYDRRGERAKHKAAAMVSF